MSTVWPASVSSALRSSKKSKFFFLSICLSPLRFAQQQQQQQHSNKQRAMTIGYVRASNQYFFLFSRFFCVDFRVAKRKIMMESESGTYKDITDEKEVMDITTKTKHCVIHFYHADFRRCMIVDKHLEVKQIIPYAINVIFAYVLEQ